MNRIPLSRVHSSETIERRIIEVVRGGNFILGPECKAFEAELATYFGMKHVVLSSSWTAAVHLLHLAQRMHGQLSEGDEILVPSLTAFPSIEPMIHAGAKPVFCDIDDTYTIDPVDAKKKITKKTRGILPVHLYGRPANIDAFKKLAADHNLWIIEDCAQSHGAKWKGKRAGGFTEHSAFSFYPSKNLTVYGDGGAIATNDQTIADRVRMLRNHGRKDKYLHEKVGFNLRFNEIQAAIGREQLKVLDECNANRRRAADWYRRELAEVKGVTLPPADKTGETESVYHMFVIRLAGNDARESLARNLKEQGIETGVHYPVPNHLQPAITEMYGAQPSLPKTEDYVKKILSLPMYPALTEADVKTVASAIKQFVKEKMAQTLDAIVRPQPPNAPNSAARPMRGGSLARMTIVVIVLIVAVLIGHLTWVRNWLADVNGMRETLATLGGWVYPASAVAVALLIACGLPRLVLCFASGAVFGFWIGLAINLAGTMLGHYAVLLFVRWGGRDWALLRWPKLRAWSDLVQENGIAGVVLVRQLPAHAMLLNLALGISRVKHRDFLIGTLIGILPEAIPATLIGAGLVKTSLKDSIGYIAIAVAGIAMIWIVCGGILRKKTQRISN